MIISKLKLGLKPNGTYLFNEATDVAEMVIIVPSRYFLITFMA